MICNGSFEVRNSESFIEKVEMMGSIWKDGKRDEMLLDAISLLISNQHNYFCI